MSTSTTTDTSNFFPPSISDNGYSILDENPSGRIAVSTLILRVKYISCASCVDTIQKKLEHTPGVLPGSARISLLTGRVTLDFNDEEVTEKRLREIIEELGYEVIESRVTHEVVLVNMPDAREETEKETVQIRIVGMTCSSCVRTIETQLATRDGVYSVRVNLMASSGVVEYDPLRIGPRDIIESVEAMGYSASLAPKEYSPASGQVNPYKHRALVALLFAVPTFVISMVFMMMLPDRHPIRRAMEHELIMGLNIGTIVLFLLATPVQLWLAWPFYSKAYASLRYTHTANMDVLVVLGTTAAYLSSVGTVIANIVTHNMAGHQFFETSVFLVTFILLGKYLEASAKRRTMATIDGLVRLQPERAVLVRYNENGDVEREEEIDLELVQVGDILKVNPGARVPCDGVITKGISTLDESSLTGESLPVTRSPGSLVLSATLNLTSPLYVRVTRTGQNTTLARIIALVNEAQSARKAPIEQLADQISSIFVPVVIVLAVVTFAGWQIAYSLGHVPRDWIPVNIGGTVFAIFFAIAVLVVACPCGLGLASPTAIMVGTGVAAKHGILVKGGATALELGHHVNCAVFDKTGTLTLGQPVVTDTLLHPVISSEEAKRNVWSLIGAIESGSEHPLAKAVAQYVAKQIETPGSSERTDDSGEKRAHVIAGWCEIVSAEEIPGSGMRAHVTPLASAADPFSGLLNSGSKEGEYIVYVGSERFLESIGAQPSEKQEVADKVHQWHEKGCSVVWVGARTKDNEDITLLAQIAIADPPRPESAEVVQYLTQRGCKVWMLTGDNTTTARAVAKKIGIKPERVISGVSPEGKAAFVKQLVEMKVTDADQEDSETNADEIGVARRWFSKLRKVWRWRQNKKNIVMMIGDGVNDTPALATAHLSVTYTSATPAATDVALVLLSSSRRFPLLSLLTFVELSTSIVYRIRQNFAWAFGYNLLAIPLAAGVFYPVLHWGLRPEIAAVAMTLSSISVVLASLLLRLWKPPAVVRAWEKKIV
ncbi:uncharacterized protein VTP21DRAFT_2092 [Calcarisporiella thermophila]|uniref:uncharacterized protein n=1 Tax=Calcarisporiella thermophila TaxID=911321 RepID=UPI0037423A82